MPLFNRSETPAHDDARTRGLLDEADRAFGRDDAYTLSDGFEDVVMEGLGTDKATHPYPPAGHSYPRRTD